MTSVFFYYKVSEERRRVIKRNLHNDPAGYCLYGARDLEKRGLSVAHNLKPDLIFGSFRHSLISHVDHYLYSWGRLWGNLETVLAHRKRANAADIVVATVDNVGIPIAFLKLMGFIRPPVIYVSIGLPEKLKYERNRLWAFLCKAALMRMSCVVSYGFEEAAWLKSWLHGNGSSIPVKFISFGVDPDYFQPSLDNVPYQTDVLSIGVDVQRDYPLLISYARKHLGTQVMIVTNKETARTLEPIPENVTVLCDVPFSEIRDLFDRTRVVALPVKENTYSGATTTLLQAMAMAKPVVISQVGAIRDGYGLKDGENCLLVKPGDIAGFETAIDRLLLDRFLADKLGKNARSQVVSSLSWNNYVDGIMGVIEKALEKPQMA